MSLQNTFIIAAQSTSEQVYLVLSTIFFILLSGFWGIFSLAVILRLRVIHQMKIQPTSRFMKGLLSSGYLHTITTWSIAAVISFTTFVYLLYTAIFLHWTI